MLDKTYHKLTFIVEGCSRKLETLNFDIHQIKKNKELKSMKLGN